MFRDYNVGLDNLNDIRIIQYGIVQKIQKINRPNGRFCNFQNNIKKGLIDIAFWRKVKGRKFTTIAPYDKEAMQGKMKLKSKGHWDKVPCHIKIDINPIRSDGKCHSGWKLSIDGKEVFCKSFKIELPESGSLVSYTMEGYAGTGWVEDE